MAIGLRDVVPRVIPEKELKGTIWDELRKDAPAGPTLTKIVDVISPGRTNLLAGAAIDAVADGDFRVLKLMVDVAPDVLCDVYLDDVLRFSTKDKLGIGGQFDLGDAGGKTYFRMRRMRVVASNTHGTDSRDVRAWLVTY